MILIFPDVQLNCAWLEEITELTNDNIKMISLDCDSILFNSDFDGWAAFVVLNFSVN